MGYGRWTNEEWTRYSEFRIRGRGVQEIYSSRGMQDKYDPALISTRESRDSADHPESTPVIIGLDVTGSMSRILQLVANKLGELVTTVLERNPVPGPQIMFNAIGDSTCDVAPLQVTQFESDIRIARQLTDLWFERGGGGNGFESYPLAWYFAADRTSTDAWEKRGKKGFLFTMGDDCFPERIRAGEIRRVFGTEQTEDVSVRELLKKTQQKYEVFHLMLMEGGSAAQIDPDRWRDLMGERAITVTDHTRIPEIIISILETVAGKNKEEIIKSWDPQTGDAVRKCR